MQVGRRTVSGVAEEPDPLTLSARGPHADRQAVPLQVGVEGEVAVAEVHHHPVAAGRVRRRDVLGGFGGVCSGSPSCVRTTVPAGDGQDVGAVVGVAWTTGPPAR